MVNSARVSARRRTQALISLSSKTLSSPKRISKSKPYYGDSCCEECGSAEHAAELLLCDQCDRGFHLFCLRPILVSVPKGSWFCPHCSNQKKKPSSMFIWSFHLIKLLYACIFGYMFMGSFNLLHFWMLISRWQIPNWFFVLYLINTSSFSILETISEFLSQLEKFSSSMFIWIHLCFERTQYDNQ